MEGGVGGRPASQMLFFSETSNLHTARKERNKNNAVASTARSGRDKPEMTQATLLTVAVAKGKAAFLVASPD